MSAKALVVLTTCGSDEDADRLAHLLVERRLAACVNAVSGVTSTYRWRGEVQRDRETLLIVKTTTAQYEALESTLRAESKYELPEVIAVPIDAGSAAYLGWLGESVGARKD
jgi:periplasmic divalent cation tolerance protein